MPRTLSRSEKGSTPTDTTTSTTKRRTGTRSSSLVPSTKSPLLPSSKQSITARLAAAGSRRAEFEALIHAAPSDATPVTLRTLVVDENVTGKRSAASRTAVWRQLKYNYVLDPLVPEYRALTEALRTTSAPSERGLLLFLMLARRDRLFREVTLQCISPHLVHPGTAIHTDDAQATLNRLLGKGQRWTEETRVTTRQHVLSALKDFGVVQGGTRKKTARLHPSPQVTLFAARLARLEGTSPRQVLTSVWFRLLGVDAEGAWNLLHAAAGVGVLRCRRQADVIELDLPPLPEAPVPVV